jgi:hypothetical protein
MSLARGTEPNRDEFHHQSQFSRRERPVAAPEHWTIGNDIIPVVKLMDTMLGRGDGFLIGSSRGLSLFLEVGRREVREPEQHQQRIQPICDRSHASINR